MISDKAANEITKVSNISPHNCSETIDSGTGNIQNLIEKQQKKDTYNKG